MFTPAVAGITLVLFTATAVLAHSGVVIEVPKLASKPRIDGDLSDWERFAWTDGVWDIDRMKRQSPPPQVFLEDSGEEPPGTALTKADLTGQYFMAWDDEGLYLGVRATDNVHDVTSRMGNSATWFLKDGCAWFFDVAHDGDGWFPSPGDHVFAFVADDSYPDGGHWWRLGENSPIVATEVRAGLGAFGARGWRYSLSWLEVPGPGLYRVKMGAEKGGGYAIEAFVPFSAYWLTTPAIGDTIGGPMIVNTDPDGGPSEFGGQLMLFGLNDNDATWADMVFVGPRR